MSAFFVRQAVEEVPQSLVRELEGNDSMRAKFEALCRKAQNDICETIEELDGEGKVRIRRVYLLCRTGTSCRLVVAHQVYLFRWCMLHCSLFAVRCARHAMDVWPPCAGHFARMVYGGRAYGWKLYRHHMRLRYTIKRFCYARWVLLMLCYTYRATDILQRRLVDENVFVDVNTSISELF